jgi:protein-disulfide isomerase
MIAAGVFVLLLYPGLHTPRSSGESGRQAVLTAAASAPAGTDFASAGAATAATSPSGASPESVSSAPSSSASSSSEISRAPAVVPEVTPVPSRAGTGDPNRDALLVELVKALDPPSRQTLADSLAVYRASAGRPLPPPRALDGSSLAPVRITEFTDILCEHCAPLHHTIRSIREHVTPDSFSVVARQCPLDARCNSLVSVTREDDVRCVAAKALICAEPSGKEPQLSAALFEKQEGLTSPKVLEIGGPMVPGLAPCIASPATQAKLNADVAIAEKFDHDGTPIVIVNGRPATSFGPFLYALIVTRGNPDNPAFDALPPGNPAAHLH